MKALMATLVLVFMAGTASAATNWQTGSSAVDQERKATAEEMAKQPHNWYGGDLYHGGNQ